MVDADDGFTPTPADLARDPHPQPRRAARGTADGIVVTPSHNPPQDGGVKYNPPHGGPADTDVTGWMQREANALLENELRDVKRTKDREQRPPPRLRLGLRRRPARRHRPRRDPRQRAAPRRRPARRRERRLLGRDRRAPRPGPDDHQRPGRPDLPLRPARLGRQDPHGLLLALRDGQAARPRRPVRRRLRQRPRRRPPRDRHAGRRPAEPQPPPRRVHRLPVRRRARLAAGHGRRQDARLERDHRPRRRRPGPAAWSRSPSASSGSSPGCSTAASASAARRAPGASFLRRDGGPWSTDKDGLIPCLLAAEMTAARRRPGRALRRR